MGNYKIVLELIKEGALTLREKPTSQTARAAEPGLRAGAAAGALFAGGDAAVAHAAADAASAAATAAMSTAAIKRKRSAGGASAGTVEQWTCGTCTLINSAAVLRCTACTAHKQKIAKRAAEGAGADESEGEGADGPDGLTPTRRRRLRGGPNRATSSDSESNAVAAAGGGAACAGEAAAAVPRPRFSAFSVREDSSQVPNI